MVTDKELIDDLQRLADELGHAPSTVDVEREGTYTKKTYYTRWDDWESVLEAAGLDECEQYGPRIGDEELLADLQRVAEIVGKPPSTVQVDKHGNHASSTHSDRFGSHQDALEAAGFEPTHVRGQKITRKELLAELRRLADEHGEPVRVADIKAHGKYSYGPYYNRFESLPAAREEAGLERE